VWVPDFWLRQVVLYFFFIFQQIANNCWNYRISPLNASNVRVDMATDMLVPTFEFLMVPDLSRAGRVCSHWGDLIDRYLVERLEMRCFHTRLTFEYDVLGFGASVEYFTNRGTRGKLKSVTSELDLLSKTAFDVENVRTGEWVGKSMILKKLEERKKQFYWKSSLNREFLTHANHARFIYGRPSSFKELLSKCRFREYYCSVFVRKKAPKWIEILLGPNTKLEIFRNFVVEAFRTQFSFCVFRVKISFTMDTSDAIFILTLPFLVLYPFLNNNFNHENAKLNYEALSMSKLNLRYFNNRPTQSPVTPQPRPLRHSLSSHPIT